MIVAMLRLVELDGGRILVDGVDIATLGLYSLRSNIAVISQDPGWWVRRWCSAERDLCWGVGRVGVGRAAGETDLCEGEKGKKKGASRN